MSFAETTRPGAWLRSQGGAGRCRGILPGRNLLTALCPDRGHEGRASASHSREHRPSPLPPPPPTNLSSYGSGSTAPGDLGLPRTTWLGLAEPGQPHDFGLRAQTLSSQVSIYRVGGFLFLASVCVRSRGQGAGEPCLSQETGKEGAEVPWAEAPVPDGQTQPYWGWKSGQPRGVQSQPAQLKSPPCTRSPRAASPPLERGLQPE